MRAVLIMSLIWLSACVSEGVGREIIPAAGELPEGYPWKMGDGVVSRDGAARDYATYDFSLGAYDASVQFRKDYDCSGVGSCKDTGKVVLSLGAYPGADPDADADVVHINGLFAALPDSPASTQTVSVVITGPDGRGGKTEVSNGPAELKVTSIARGRDGSDNYGLLTASVTATVCEAKDGVLIKGGQCHAFTANFSTQVQYDSV